MSKNEDGQEVFENVTVVAWNTGWSKSGQFFEDKNTVVVDDMEYDVDTKMDGIVYVDHF